MQSALVLAVMLLVAIGGYFFVDSSDALDAARVQMQGTWVSADDPTFVREYEENGTVIDTQGGEVSQKSGRWTLFTKEMPVEGYSHDLQEKHIYLAVGFTETPTLHFRIETINARNLSLVSLESGAVLTFVKK